MSVWSSVEVHLGSYGRAFGDHHSEHVCYRNPYMRKSKVCRCLIIGYVGKYVVNPLTPNDPYRGRTAPLLASELLFFLNFSTPCI